MVQSRRRYTFFQISEFVESEYLTYIYWIDEDDGEILLKYDLKLDYEATTCLSKLIIDKNDHLFVIGNSLDENGGTGLFTQKIDLLEGKIQEKFHPITNDLPNDF